MKTIESIKKDIADAWQELKSIKLNMEKNWLFSETKNQQELMNKIGNICDESYGCFMQSCNSMWGDCLSLLEDVLTVSEGLKSTYVCPAEYNMSNEIFDIMKEVEKAKNSYFDH